MHKNSRILFWPVLLFGFFEAFSLNALAQTPITQTVTTTLSSPWLYGNGDPGGGLYSEQAMLNNPQSLYGFGTVGLGYFPNTGTLQSLTINVTGSAYGSVDVASSTVNLNTGLGTSSGTLNYEQISNLVLNGIAIGSQTTTTGQGSYSGTGNGTGNPGEPSYAVVTLAPIPVSESITITDPTTLSELRGSNVTLGINDAFGLTAYSSTSAGGDSIQTCYGGTRTNINGSTSPWTQTPCQSGGSYTATLTYTYLPASSGGGTPSPVPLPAAMWLLLGGLGGLGAFARKKLAV
jgi:hypothetical protein